MEKLSTTTKVALPKAIISLELISLSVGSLLQLPPGVPHDHSQLVLVSPGSQQKTANSLCRRQSWHLIKFWLCFTTLPVGLVSGAEEVGEPLHEDGDEEDGGGEGGQLDLLQNGGEKGEVR